MQLVFFFLLSFASLLALIGGFMIFTSGGKSGFGLVALSMTLVVLCMHTSSAQAALVGVISKPIAQGVTGKHSSTPSRAQVSTKAHVSGTGVRNNA